MRTSAGRYNGVNSFVAFKANDSSDELRQAANLRTGEYSIGLSSTERLLLERIPFLAGLLTAPLSLFHETSAVGMRVLRALGLSEKRQMATDLLVQLEFYS